MTVDLTHTAGEAQRTAAVKSDRGNVEQLPVFTDKQTIAGHVHLSPAPGKKIDHLGVKIEVLGQTELYFDRGDAHDERGNARGAIPRVRRAAQRAVRV